MTDWLEQALRDLGPWSVFVSAFIGPYLFPAAGELAIVTAVGLGMSPALVMVMGVAGGAASDQLAFGLGKFGGTPLARRLISPEKRAKLAHRMDKHAVLALVGGRMLTGARTWLAILAGVGQVRYGKFSVLNALGCVLWAAMFVGIGLAFGASADVEGLVESILRWAWPIFFGVLALMIGRAVQLHRQRSEWQHEGEVE